MELEDKTKLSSYHCCSDLANHKSSNGNQKIVMHYPVSGHLYIHPDRMLGVIERNIRKMESVVHPDE